MNEARIAKTCKLQQIPTFIAEKAMYVSAGKNTPVTAFSSLL